MIKKINQNIIDGFFNMVMIAEMGEGTIKLAELQKILSEERMAVMYIQPDGTAGEEPDDEEEMEE